MGIIMDQKEAVLAAAQETAKSFTIPPYENTTVNNIVSPNASLVETKFEPIQSLTTQHGVAVGMIDNRWDNLQMKITPSIEREIYSVDVVDDNGRVVYNINAHSGPLKMNLPLPKGKYHYYLKNHGSNDFAYAVNFE